MAASSALPGCGGGSSVGPPTTTTSASTPQPIPGGPLTVASVDVTGTSAGSIGANFVGFSYEKSEMVHPFFSASNSDLVGLFKLIGPGLLRIGGTGTDQLTWTPDGPGQTWPQIAESDINSWAAFVKASGWQVLYAVNFGGSALPVGTRGYTTPALAAAEIAYVSSQLGSLLYGVEIGNEPDKFGGYKNYYACDWSLAQYEALWNEYRSAILAATPGVLIAGPAAGHLPTWTVPFSETEAGSNLDLVTYHYYKLTGVYPPGTGCNGPVAGSGSPQTTADLIAYPDKTLISNLGLLATAKQKTGIPYRLGETNSGSMYTTTVSGIPGVSNSYASALWVIDHLFTCALGGATGVNLTSGGGAYYSPISDNQSAVTNVQPAFYGALLFYLAGQGTLYSTQVSAGSLNVSAYAVNASTGVNVIVVNKDTVQNLQLTVSMPQNVASATLIALTQLSPGATSADLAATSGVMLQGSTISTAGSYSPSSAYTLTANGPQVSCYVPAMSAVLIQSS